MPDDLLALGEPKPLEELGRISDREGRDCGDGLPINEDREALGLQPAALADRAERQRAVILFLVFIILAEHRAALGRFAAQTVAGGSGPGAAPDRGTAQGTFRLGASAG